MYLAVLSARHAAEEAAKLGGDTASTVLGPAQGWGPDSRQWYGWGQLADGPLHPAPAQDALQLPQGQLAGWPWERGFAEAARVGRRRCSGHRPQARSLTSSWPWTLSPTTTGRSRPGRAIAMPGKCCRHVSGRACCGRRSTCQRDPASRRDLAGGKLPVDVRLSSTPGGIPEHGAYGVAWCLHASPPCGSTCSSSSSTAWSSGCARYRPRGLATRNTSLPVTCHGAQEVGPRRARTRSCARSARGRWGCPGRAHPRQRTSGRHRAACASSTKSRCASIAGWRDGGWRTAARGVTRDTRWQWQG